MSGSYFLGGSILKKKIGKVWKNGHFSGGYRRTGEIPHRPIWVK